MDSLSRFQTLADLIRRRWALLLVLAWLPLIVVAFGLLELYKAAPGSAAQAPASWPTESGVPRDASVPQLVMLVHPLCPCSRASIAELERVMAKTRGGMRADLLFLAPLTADPSWQESDLRARASRIPGVHVHDDVDGEKARRFGGFTSGQTYLYGTDGRLRFAGGITGSRGHEGDNYGADAVVAAVLRDAGGTATSPVFGCSLVAPTAPGAGDPL